MRLLLDTHIVIWSFAASGRLSPEARQLITDSSNEIWISVVSLWEIGVKRALGHASFDYDPRMMRRTLLENGYRELTLTGEHALGVGSLPALHKDPFDRMLVAQAMVEGLTLITADKALTKYPGLILKV